MKIYLVRHGQVPHNALHQYNTKDEDFDINNPGNMPIVERRLTWLDIIYQAAMEVVKDKHILITRYPMK